MCVYIFLTVGPLLVRALARKMVAQGAYINISIYLSIYLHLCVCILI